MKSGTHVNNTQKNSRENKSSRTHCIRWHSNRDRTRLFKACLRNYFIYVRWKGYGGTHQQSDEENTLHKSAHEVEESQKTVTTFMQAGRLAVST